MNDDENINSSVPHLTTALTGPLLEIEKVFLKQQVQIETWFRHAWIKTPAPIQSSVDLRNAGFKLAPVDTNLFPGGFNNLSKDTLPLSIQAIQATLALTFRNCDKIVIIPENHTRNIPYLESLATFQYILIQAGFNTRIGSLLPDLTTPLTIDLPSGNKITLHPLKQQQRKIYVENFSPCLIILNNDLSEGTPAILQNNQQIIRPPTELGWSNRLKSTHFSYYNDVAIEFAKLVNIDPWFINPLFMTCDNIDFKTREGEHCVVETAEKLFEKIKKKYQEHSIKTAPFIIIKADAGTYGMGVMTVTDPQQILELNRKQRSRLSARKGTKNVDRFILQEGVYTFETVEPDNAVAEPVVYMLGNHVVGGFYRVHSERGPNENLNSPGMHFKPLAFAKPCNISNENFSDNENQNRFYAYSVIARLALLAAAKELKAITNG